MIDGNHSYIEFSLLRSCLPRFARVNLSNCQRLSMAYLKYTCAIEVLQKISEKQNANNELRTLCKLVLYMYSNRIIIQSRMTLSQLPPVPRHMRIDCRRYSCYTPASEFCHRHGRHSCMARSWRFNGGRENGPASSTMMDNVDIVCGLTGPRSNFEPAHASSGKVMEPLIAIPPIEASAAAIRLAVAISFCLSPPGFCADDPPAQDVASFLNPPVSASIAPSPTQSQPEILPPPTSALVNVTVVLAGGIDARSVSPSPTLFLTARTANIKFPYASRKVSGSLHSLIHYGMVLKLKIRYRLYLMHYARMYLSCSYRCIFP